MLFAEGALTVPPAPLTGPRRKARPSLQGAPPPPPCRAGRPGLVSQGNSRPAAFHPPGSASAGSLPGGCSVLLSGLTQGLSDNCLHVTLGQSEDDLHVSKRHRLLSPSQSYVSLPPRTRACALAGGVPSCSHLELQSRRQQGDAAWPSQASLPTSEPTALWEGHDDPQAQRPPGRPERPTHSQHQPSGSDPVFTYDCRAQPPPSNGPQ